MWHMGVECARKACQTLVLLVLLVFWFSREKTIKPIKTNPTIQKTFKKTNKTKNNVLRLMWHMGVECARKACQTLVLLVFWFSLEKQIKPIKTNPTVKKPSKKQIKPKNQCFETYVAYGSRMCKESLPDIGFIGFIGFLVFPRKNNKTNKNQSNHPKNLQKNK